MTAGQLLREVLDPLIDRMSRRVRPSEASLVLDSRQIQPGDVFLACAGLRADGRHFIGDAVARGAKLVVCERGLTPDQRDSLAGTPAIEVDGLRALLGPLADRWWGHPSSQLQIIAVTGTNGKTTTTQLIGAALRASGRPCAALGTLGLVGPDGELMHDGTLTTPDVVSMHHMIAHVVRAGARFLVLEASSIGLDQGRLDAVRIHTALFTNLTQDHLDYHHSMQAYGQAKARLFARPELVRSILNADDPAALTMAQACRAPVTWFGTQSDAQWRAFDIRDVSTGMRFQLCHSGRTTEIHSGFVGRYNVSNLLAVAATLESVGMPFEEIAAALSRLPSVPGRMEPVSLARSQGQTPLVLVDYAHTPDALESALRAVRGIAESRRGRVWCVAGCGGDRDRSKRAPMGAVLSTFADRFVVTSDNPRSEDPQSILEAVWSGVTDPARGSMELAREAAILRAIWQAQASDVVLIAGKGHETYQEAGGVRRMFDDRQWARLGLLFYGSGPHDAIAPVAIDSRQVTPGSLFVAIHGDRFDGHDFVGDVVQKGAVAALVSRRQAVDGIEQIVVDDTRTALQSLAHAWRGRFELPVIGVTGSNGKTTTKEMIAAILRQWVGEPHVLATQGNLNNDLGVPLTLMRMRAEHRVAVIELGMNHPGEIADLARIAAPTIGLVLNAQREHQEFMQSVQAVAQENGQVLTSLGSSATAVFMDQPPYTELWGQLGQNAGRRWLFGLECSCDVHASEIHFDKTSSRFMMHTPLGQRLVLLQVPGVHNVLNALASAACTLAAGASLDNVLAALDSFAPVKGRMQLHPLSHGRLLIDDSYNANPDSVRAAIDVLSNLPATRALVLGDMGEVGSDGPAMHREVGRYAKLQGIEHLFTIGKASLNAAQAFGDRAMSFDTVDGLVAQLQELAPRNILIKGSRFMALERVVAAVLAQETSAHHENAGENGHAG